MPVVDSVGSATLIPENPSRSPRPPATSTNAQAPAAFTPRASASRYSGVRAVSVAPAGTVGVSPAIGFSPAAALRKSSIDVFRYSASDRFSSNAASCARSTAHGLSPRFFPFFTSSRHVGHAAKRCAWSSRIASASALAFAPRPRPWRGDGIAVWRLDLGSRAHVERAPKLRGW